MNRTRLIMHNSTSANQSYDVNSNGLLGYVIGLVGFVCVMTCLSLFCQLRSFRERRSRHQLNSLVNALSPEEAKARKQYVKSTLPHRRLAQGNVSKNDQHGSSPTKIMLTPQSDSSSSDDLELADPVNTAQQSQLPLCSICLGQFSAGDQISWSTNPRCSHEYHRDCIYAWLLKHSDCPICRQVYLPEPRSSSLARIATIDATVETPHPSAGPIAAIVVAMARQWINFHQPQSTQTQELQRADDERPENSVALDQQHIVDEEQTQPVVQDQPPAFDEEQMQAHHEEKIQIVVEEEPRAIAGEKMRTCYDKQQQASVFDEPQNHSDEMGRGIDEERRQQADHSEDARSSMQFRSDGEEQRPCDDER